jgi:4-amino-4-deoxy-L-arabinose transferase-like glycosyltransferase
VTATARLELAGEALRVRGLVALLPALGVLVAATLVFPLRRARGDELSYLSYAQRLAHGGYADFHSPWPVDYLWHGPGLPLLLGPLVGAGAPLAVIRLAGAVLLFTAVVVFFNLTAHFTSRRVALAASYGLLLYLPVYTVLGPVHVEPLATLLFTLGILGVVRAVDGAERAHLWAGAAFGLLALSRVEYGWGLLVCGCVAVAWLVARRRSVPARRLAVSALVGLACCAPWLIYTYTLTSRPLYWANSGGLSLYWMSVPTKGNLGDWHPPFISEGGDFPSASAAAVRPNAATLARVLRLPPLEQDFRLERLALENIRRQPIFYLRNVVNNASRLLFNFPYSYSEQTARPLLYALPNAVLLGALCVAVALVGHDRRRLRPEAGVVAALVALGFALHLPFSAFGRFTLPLVPATVWMVIVTLAPLASRTERA